MPSWRADSPTPWRPPSLPGACGMVCLGGILALLALLAMAGLDAPAWPAGGWQQLQQEAQQRALEWQQRQPLLFALAFFAAFASLSMLALPGCSLLALAAGLFFGVAGGTLLVVLASTLGALGAFLASRHLLRAAVQRRFARQHDWLERHVEHSGVLTLFSLRLAPVLPYWLVNPIMGLTRMRAAPFFLVSLLGMLPGSAAYVQAGSELARWGAGGPFWSPQLVAALLALALLPWLGRWTWRRAQAVTRT